MAANNKNKICIYAICKNESKFVEKWLDSMSEADYIVVLDTGSTDDTYDKLRNDSRVTRVEQKVINPWRFDEARNESLKLVPDDANILMCTDLDELLDPGWAQPLRDNWVEGVHTRCTYKYVWSHNEAGNDGRVFGYNKIHSKKWIWRYPVHELLWDTEKQTENYPEEESLNLFDSIKLHHWPDRTKSRKSYLPLLEMREAQYPDDLYGLIYLAHEYTYQGMYEKSIEKLDKVVKCYADKGIYNNLEIASCYLFKGDAYSTLNNLDQAIVSYLKGIELQPSYRELYLNLAKVYLKKNDYQLAIHYIKKGIENSYRHYTWLERDTSWCEEPYDLLSLAYYYNGEKIKSLACALKALDLNPIDKRLIDNVNSIKKSITEKDLLK